MKTALTEFVLDRRGEKRKRCSEPVWWNCGARSRKVGWLLERSPRGAAFISLGSRAPRIAEPVEVSTWSPEDRKWSTVRGYVRRVQHIHGDLYLIGMFCLVDRPRIVERTARARRSRTTSATGERARLRLAAA